MGLAPVIIIRVTPSARFKRSMIITVTAVRVVQMTGYEIIGMTAVGDCFVSTVRGVGMAFIVPTAIMRWRASLWVICAHVNTTLINMIFVHVVHMTIVEIIAVVPMPNRFVPAVGSVPMVVILMLLVVTHDISPLLCQ